MNPLLKGFLIGLAIMMSLTILLNVTAPSEGVVGVSVILAASLCALIVVKLYADSKPQ